MRLALFISRFTQKLEKWGVIYLLLGVCLGLLCGNLVHNLDGKEDAVEVKTRIEINQSALRYSKSLQSELETNLKNNSPTKAGYRSIDKTEKSIRTLYVTEDNYIFIYTLTDQLLVVFPKVSGDKIIWICEGGAEEYVPEECRHGSNMTL